ncbi:hypothetical protein IX317_000637 [Fusobacterium sp. DD29]|uniref:hypothetical protein n=1 Tax=unclassified Fusobacterium TaxID=2648384 RepID=UPI001B8AA515|nr:MULTISPECIES: hypothetical protein [unclassified Fusobacterium]MBR8700241.1 hypothetical protein [Fusobacterium sp. DD45]MBR8710504.1 hypothetical protein [Fusobacterium sp. DD28]MBR8748976.1 hypothetical protein [Fusobacterium sp. DD29]MBR8751046.1 hypothetical protein [Fusobacterium sp. DD26]MBR8761282.1 hypothetical protein [Fusobacterium sp. DD25]
MDFKKILQSDIDAVFINELEFADDHIVGDKITKCVLDEERFQTKQNNRINSLTDEGVYLEGLTMFIASSFFNCLPHAGEIILLDNKKYTVISCKSDMGIAEIDLVNYSEV